MMHSRYIHTLLHSSLYLTCIFSLEMKNLYNRTHHKEAYYEVCYFFLGLAVVFFLAFIASNNKKHIKFKPIFIMLIIQLILTFLLLNTEIGLILVTMISNVFTKLLAYAASGVNFVFGGITNKGEMPFFLNVLLPIVFISVLIGILQHFKILPFCIRWIGFFLSKINGLGKLESYNAVASAIVGQSEVFITVKNSLRKFQNIVSIHYAPPPCRPYRCQSSVLI